MLLHSCCRITPLYAVNMFYYHWLKKKLNWPLAGQNRTKQEIQAKIREKKGGIREKPAAAGEARCEVASHEHHGKIETNRKGFRCNS